MDNEDWPPEPPPQQPPATGLEQALHNDLAVPWRADDPDAIACADELAETLRQQGIMMDEVHAQTRFLSALSGLPSERLARKASGASRADLARWRGNEAFRRAEREAIRESADILLASAWQKATEGTLEAVFQSGRLVGWRRVLSERLHEVLLKGLMPHLFDRQNAVTTTHQTIVLQSPEAIAEAVRKLSPTLARRTPLPPTPDAPR